MTEKTGTNGLTGGTDASLIGGADVQRDNGSAGGERAQPTIQLTADGSDGGNDSPGSVSAPLSLKRFLVEALLYVLGVTFLIMGLALITVMPLMALGFFVSAALVMPIIRRMVYRVTHIRIPTALRVALVLVLPALPNITEEFQRTARQQQAEQQALTAELQSNKPALLMRLKTLIAQKAYQNAVTQAARFERLHDPDINELGKQATKLLAEQEALEKRKLEGQKNAAAAEARRQEFARCDANDACFSKKFETEARLQCKPLIEVHARYEHQWTDGVFGPSTFFSAYVDRDAGTIRFSGNQLKLQNGFGAWQQYRYECLFDYRHNKVVTAEVNG